MLQFTSTDLGNKTGDVLAAAAQEPVAITRHGKRRFVLLTTEKYEALKTSGDPRIARRTADIPSDEGKLLVAELTRLMDADD
ncbi:MAG: type II toxin-antitoxin system prevent-host-death family antitoxin [Boseongicola sp.]|nr:type II toxin-antitoxin system prevent-host-death family antitoxin [Boseongicola sp.]